MGQSPITRAWNKKFEGKRKSKKVKDEGRKPYSESATGDKLGGALERPSRVTAIALSLRHHISATRETWQLEVNIQEGKKELISQHGRCNQLDPSLLPFGWPHRRISFDTQILKFSLISLSVGSYTQL